MTQPAVQQQPVQIINDGAGLNDGAGPGAGAPVTPASSVPVRRRINLSLIAAWILVGLTLGFAWYANSLPPSQVLFESGRVTSGLGSIVHMNLLQLAPFLLPLGIMGAFTLLVVQGSAFRRNARP